MKGKLLALLLSLIVSGTVGLYTKNVMSDASTTSKEVSSASSESTSSETATSEDLTDSSTVSVQSSSSEVSSQSPQQTSTESSESSSSQTVSSTAQNSNTGSSAENGSQETSSTNSDCTTAQTTSDSNSCQNYNDYKNNILNQMAGNNCSQTTSKVISSQPNTSVPSSNSDSTSSNTSSSTSSSNTATGTYADFQNQVLELVNHERTSRGLNALTMDTALNKTATLKSEDMANLGYFDHTSPTYGSPFDMMKQFGISYQSAGENIAMGQTSPEQVMTGWMNSEGHRANILNSSFTKIGIGIAQNSNGQYYWTQQFIG